MRILHVLNHTRRLNGHVHAALDLACAQKALGHEVSIASEGGDFDQFLAQNDVGTVMVDHRRKVGSLMKGARSLQRAIGDLRPDVVHAHMMTSAVLARPLCSLARIPLVTTVHNEFQKSSILMGMGTRVIAVSEAVAASMRRRGVSGSRLRVVLNGTIGAARFANIDREPQELAGPSIIFVGGLHPRKGLPDLLTAFADVHSTHPDARLYVLGGGPFKETYEAQAKALPCATAIAFLGALDNPFGYLKGADIFALPSHADPAPLVLSEAREAGCAIVATHVDGIPQLLEQGKAGILIPPHDPAALATALKSLVSDKAALQQWRARSQINIDYLKIERVATETLAVYRSAYESVRGRKSLARLDSAPTSPPSS